MLLVIWQTGHLIYSVLDDKASWEKEGIMLALEFTAIEQVEKVSLYHGKDRYTVVQGKNASDIPMIAWFKDGSFEGFEYEKDVIPQERIEEQVRAQVKIKEWVRLQPGMEDRRPVWEAVLIDEENKFNYYYYDMLSGQFIRSYRLQKENS